MTIRYKLDATTAYEVKIIWWEEGSQFSAKKGGFHSNEEVSDFIEENAPKGLPYQVDVRIVIE